jgi:hypothetical protein
VGLIALATLAGALALARRRRGTLRAWSITTAVLAFVLLITLRVARGRILVQVKVKNRDAVGAVHDVLAGSLRAWTLWLLVIAMFVMVETLVWGHLGLVSEIRRGYGTARQQIARRREARALAAGSAAAGGPEAGGPEAGATDAATAIAAESWPKRVAAETRAFVEGLEVQRHVAGLGIFVRDHFDAARWSGIVLGVFVLLIWPALTLSASTKPTGWVFAAAYLEGTAQRLAASSTEGDAERLGE